MLVLIGATEDGHKEFIGLHDGNRESKQSWKDFLQNLKSRGLSIDPSLAIGDGALGFWAAIEEEYPRCRHQRCWVHKTANIWWFHASRPKITKSRLITSDYFSSC